MGEWKKSGCVLCAQNCGLEMWVEENKIVKVRGDKENPRSKGYCCRKGLSVAHYQHNADRLKYPLKKVDGKHVRISWEQAIAEIAEKALAIRAEYGPRSFAYMGGGGLGGHFEAVYGVRLMRALGSQYLYSAITQEFSNTFWVEGRLVGRQAIISTPDMERAETVLAWGWNGWLSHQEPRTRIQLQEISKDESRMLVVIDPRRSETADKADLHLPICPGTDSTLLKAMISIIISEGWENTEWMIEHVNGWEAVRPWFEDFDARRGIEEVCQLNYDEVYTLCQRWVSTRSVIHQDLGIYMNRHSTINTYMIHILRLLGGHFCVPGGQVFPAVLMPMGSHSDERQERTWRTVITDMYPVLGNYPPAVFPEEILGDHPERLRMALISATNPVRSFPDTKAYEAALERLDLSVCIDTAYSETARCCQYVLPACSYYESYDATFFNFNWPELYFQLRTPILAMEPDDESHEKCSIFLDLARAMGLVPECPPELYAAAEKGLDTYSAALFAFLSSSPANMKNIPLIVGETLGKALGSVNHATLFTMLLGKASSSKFRAGAAAAGFPDDGTQTVQMFNAITKNHQGTIIARMPGDNIDMLRTEDKKFAVHIEELREPLAQVTVENELKALAMPKDFPMILHSGLHVDTNANSVMRNPVWNNKHRWGTMLINAADAERLGIIDGEKARVITKASSVEIEAEVSERAAVGCVYIPHGFGIIYDGKKYGVNVNELVKTTDRDEMCTPLHRRIPCRVEKV
ncbi:MAG: molybdopterin-containing oxidoreductase family protein [Methylocystaceae bacterium]